MENKKVLPPLRHKPYGGAWSVQDSDVCMFLKNIEMRDGNLKNFVDDYFEWFKEGNTFDGLEHFEQVDFTAGTTEAFHMFYFRHLGKRLRLFKDEYFYHHMMRRNYFKDYLDINPSTLDKGDVVVMSCPFSGTGNLPADFYLILQTCEDLSIPVMLDLAYINISSLNALDLNYKCIETVTTSLSKVFPVEKYRVGIRLERKAYDDPVHAYNQNNYVNLQSVQVGHELIKKFDNKWLVTKYKELQKNNCKKLSLTPSKSVIFGLADKGTFDDYNRGGTKNRLCFSRIWDGRIKIIE